MALNLTENEANTTGAEPVAVHPSSPLMDPVAAGAYIGGSKPIGVLTLADWRCKGTGPAFLKVSRLIRYRQADLDAWLDQGRVTPGRV